MISKSRTRNCVLPTPRFAMPSFSHVRMRTNHLAMKCNYLCKIAELEIQLMCRDCLKIAWSGQWFFSRYCVYLLRKPVRTNLLLCDRWQASAQACICC